MGASGEKARDYSMQGGLEVKLEALLFASPGPASIDQLAAALEVEPAAVRSALVNLEAQYAQRGLRIQHHKGGAQMTSAPEYAPEIEKLLQLDSQAHLSRAALEVLAIVTYKQPITRPEIDSIRGVNSDSSLKTLLRHGLLEEIGRTSGPGRPILYGTSGEFLQHFGLSSLEDLPSIETESLGEASSPAEELMGKQGFAEEGDRHVQADGAQSVSDPMIGPPEGEQPESSSTRATPLDDAGSADG